MIDFVSNTLITTANALNNQAQMLGDIRQYDIECSMLKDFLNENIRESREFNELFNQLNPIKGPCVYWYEIVSENTTKEILDAFKTYRDNEDRNRAIPALKSEDSNYSTSKILYVGKVKRDFYGRVIQHLGCHRTARTQGLQLYYWAKEIDLKLKLHILEFDNSMENIVSVVELALAEKLKPLIGKHK